MRHEAAACARSGARLRADLRVSEMKITSTPGIRWIICPTRTKARRRRPRSRPSTLCPVCHLRLEPAELNGLPPRTSSGPGDHRPGPGGPPPHRRPCPCPCPSPCPCPCPCRTDRRARAAGPAPPRRPQRQAAPPPVETWSGRRVRATPPSRPTHRKGQPSSPTGHPAHRKGRSSSPTAPGQPRTPAGR